MVSALGVRQLVRHVDGAARRSFVDGVDERPQGLVTVEEKTPSDLITSFSVERAIKTKS